MNLKIIVLASAGFFLIMTPASHSHLWGLESTTAPSEKVAAVPKNDADITKEIKDEINSDKEFEADAANVVIKTENGKVTLSGTVSDQDTKNDVEVVAKDFAGDDNVINDIVVKPEQ